MDLNELAYQRLREIKPNSQGTIYWKKIWLKLCSNFSIKNSGLNRTVAGSRFSKKNAEDATFYDINDDKKTKEKLDQKRIDEILDKISESGYQNLSAEEKRILFEASKKK